MYIEGIFCSWKKYFLCSGSEMGNIGVTEHLFLFSLGLRYLIINPRVFSPSSLDMQTNAFPRSWKR